MKVSRTERVSRIGLGASGILVSAILTACGSQVAAGPRTAASAPTADASVLLPPGTSIDAATFAYPEELARITPMVFSGTVVEVTNGPTVSTMGSNQMGMRNAFALVKVKVVQKLKVEGDQLRDGFAYVQVARGVEMIDKDSNTLSEKNGASMSTVRAVDSIADGLPQGTRVVVFGTPVPDPALDQRYTGTDGSAEVKIEGPGAPSGSTVVEAGTPQTFSIEEVSGKMSGWTDLDFQGLSQALISVGTAKS